MELRLRLSHVLEAKRKELWSCVSYFSTLEEREVIRMNTLGDSGIERYEPSENFEVVEQVEIQPLRYATLRYVLLNA
jgi:hypothetical protein